MSDSYQLTDYQLFTSMLSRNGIHWEEKPPELDIITLTIGGDWYGNLAVVRFRLDGSLRDMMGSR